MSHRDIIAAHGILTARTAGNHQAIAFTELLHVGLAFQLGKPRHHSFVIKQFAGIMPQQQVVHALDVLAGSVHMATNQAVPARVSHQLHPGHVHLHQCGAAPLARLEQDDAHRKTRHALTFHQCQQPPLGTVEHQRHIAAAHLVLDGHTSGAPEFKILLDALPFLLHRIERQIVGTAGEHLARH